MKATEKALSRGAILLLWIVTIAVELLMSWILLIQNGLVAIMRGYWSFFWIFFAGWAVFTIVWIPIMATFISRKKRGRFKRAIKTYFP